MEVGILWGMSSGGCHGSRGRMGNVMGRRPWGYMHGDAMEVGAVWGRHGEEAVGIYAWGCHGSRAIWGRHGEEAVGIYAGGGRQEEERWRREVGASFEI